MRVGVVSVQDLGNSCPEALRTIKNETCPPKCVKHEFLGLHPVDGTRFGYDSDNPRDHISFTPFRSHYLRQALRGWLFYLEDQHTLQILIPNERHVKYFEIHLL